MIPVPFGRKKIKAIVSVNEKRNITINMILSAKKGFFSDSCF